MFFFCTEGSMLRKIFFNQLGAAGEKSALNSKRGMETPSVEVFSWRSVISHQVGLSAFNCESMRRGAVKFVNVTDKSGDSPSPRKKTKFRFHTCKARSGSHK